MFTVYAIRSETHDYIYVGLTDNMGRRIKEHNNGYNKTTKPYAPYTLIYNEKHTTRE